MRTGGGASSINGGSGVTPPEKFGNFMCKMGHLGTKIALCFDYKQTAILTQTFGQKWFSQVE